MTTVTEEPKFINSRAYPVIMLDGQGGKYKIAPGQVIQGRDFQRWVDYKNGITPYSGPRLAGEMARITTQTPMTQNNALKFGSDDVPGIKAPKIEGSQTTQKVSSTTTGPIYLDKTVEKWAKTAKGGGLDSFSRGQLLGLGQFMGLDFNENTPKKEIVSHLNRQLERFLPKKEK